MGVFSAIGSALGSIGGGLSSALGFGGGAGGDIIGSLIQSDQNRRESRRNRAFQKEMFINKYQFAAKDLEKAGLNRMLALGEPGGVPSGSAIGITAPQMGATGQRMQAAAIVTGKHYYQH